VTAHLEQISAQVEDWASAAGAWMEDGWAWILAAAFGLLLAFTVAAPLLASAGAAGLATIIYKAGSLMCHQQPERSFWLAGHTLAVCARDTGLFAGAFAGATIYALWKRVRLPGIVAIISCLPLVIDGGTQLLGFRESTNLLRVITGVMAALAVLLYLLPKIGSLDSQRSTSHQPPASHS